ncbi:MAG: DUF4870 domain-containing protein [Austwickia sp.]|nr:DUF4870 domain-containing protein [Austwickia sp.]
MAAFIHVSPLLAVPFVLTPLAPLVCRHWAAGDGFVRAHASEAVNFNLTTWLLTALVFLGIWTPAPWSLFLVMVLPLLAAYTVINHVGAGVRALRGQDPGYPLRVRFLR